MKGWLFKKVVNTQKIAGVFKCLSTIQMPDDDPEDVYRDFKQFLQPSNLVCRLYVLKGKSLTPNDNKNSDPYLFIKCGSLEINDEKNSIDDTNNPGFYKHFDIAVSIPGASTLKIQVWDDDGIIGDDLIGETKIDLEERWFSEQWRKLNDAANITKVKEIETIQKKYENKDENKEEEKKAEGDEKNGLELKNEEEVLKVPIEERTLTK